MTPTPENCIFPPLLQFGPMQVGTDGLSEHISSLQDTAFLRHPKSHCCLGLPHMVTGMYKTCAYFLWKPKPISPETKLSNTQPAEQVSGLDCPAGHCQLAQFTAQHKASSMRTNAPHTHTHPSCKHPGCTKRKSDEDPHQGGTPDTTTRARARFQLSPREAHRSSDDHAGLARCQGCQCQADTRPATHPQCHQVLLVKARQPCWAAQQLV